MDVTITNDPARIAEFRIKADPLKQLLQELSELSFYDHELVMLRERRAEAVPKLLEIARRLRLRELDGVKAMLALCMLEDPAVLPIAREALQMSGEAAPLRSDLMTDEARFLGTDPEIQRILLDGLDSPDPERAMQAVYECGFLAPPGAVDRFVELLQKPDTPDRPRLAFWIGQLDPTVADLKAIEAVWLDEPPGDGERTYLDAVAASAENGPPEVRRVVVEILLRYFRECLDGVRPFTDVPLDSSLRALRRAASDDPRCVEIAAALVRARLGLKGLNTPLDVLAAGDRIRHRAVCLELLQDPDAQTALRAAWSLGAGSSGIEDEEVVAAVRAAMAQHGSREAYRGILAKIEGSSDESAAEDGEEAAIGLDRMRIFWRKRGIDLRAALARMAALGVLRDVDGLAEAVLEELHRDYPGREFAPADVFLEVLERAGVKIDFEPKAGFYPPRHDRLIRRLAEATRGRLIVEAAAQVWDWDNPPDISDEEYQGRIWDTGYLVEFLHDGRLVTFQASYLGRSYDVTALMTALNEALRAAGRRERFHYSVNHRYYGSYLFLSPEAAEVAREEFFLSVEKPLQAG